MQNKIILADSHEETNIALTRILAENYIVTKLTDTVQILDYLSKNLDNVAAILVGHAMLQASGFALIRALRQCRQYDKIPILVICGESVTVTDDDLSQYNIAECICTPLQDALVRLRVKNVIRLYQYQNTMHKQHKLLKIQSDRLTKNNETIIDALGDIVEYRNVESGEHIHRVKEYTKILATEAMNMFPEFGLTPEKVALIVTASPLHDIGKIALPDKILMKPGRLTDQEFEYIKSHTISGCEILDNISSVWGDEYARVCKEICRSHHERYDGSGYPDGLHGSEIPISAQLVSIADVYDALTNERVYKDAIPKDHAFRMIVNGECGVFSPKLMECLRNVKEQFENV